ncbi:TetR family transcriptional regulator [Mycolicibacterium conceptionense]|uniref:TetR family transcriptional regulator n=1 Tax=Mycolicibacterium conceptionense TaxID=451644 RepID=A0A0U1DEI6_9MYCO|nr:TetR family transcriptional regulator [Mycolicibacterium conceptionense]
MAKQPTAEKRQRRERGSINPEDIIKGAFELAEQVSIDNLSMPLLGKHLASVSRASTGTSARRTICSTR